MKKKWISKTVLFSLTFSALFLTGCSVKTYDAGHSESTVEETVMTETEQQGEMTWYDIDGEHTEKAEILDVKFGKEAEDIMKQYDISKISPPEEDTKWVAFRVEDSHDGNVPVKVLNEDGTALSKFGIEYKGECYYLGDGYYCCAVPRGKNKIILMAGNMGAVAEDLSEAETGTKPEENIETRQVQGSERPTE